MQFFDNRLRFLYPNLLVYMGEILLQFLNFFLNYLTFFQSYGYINILRHIFNSARNNQQRVVIHSRHGFCERLFRWEGNIAFHSRQDQSKIMLNFMLKPCYRNLFKIADLFCHLASSFNRTARLHTWQSWLKTDCYQPS